MTARTGYACWIGAITSPTVDSRALTGDYRGRLDTARWLAANPGDAHPCLREREEHRKQMLANIFRASGDEGQGLAEYALILALIAIVAIGALLFLGGAISSILSQIGAAI